MNQPAMHCHPRLFAGLRILAAAATLACVAGSAIAQGAPPPPRLEPLPESQQPQAPNIGVPGATVKPGESDNRPGTTDLRDNTGAIVETQVRTPVSSYIVRPNRQVGNAQPGDAQSVGNRAAQFKIGEFGLGRAKKADDVPQTLEPAPMPPAMPAKN